MLEIKDVSFSFGEKEILSNVGLKFEPDKIYGIVGPNGVGKTTFFRILSSFYKPTKGTIKLSGVNINSRDVSFLQTTPFFYPYMKGLEYLEIVSESDINFEKAIHMARKLNLNLDQLVSTYSTGMKKKLAFIQVAISNRKVKIFDEPFSGVDLLSNEMLMSWFLQPNPKTISLISSHILGTLHEICDEILYITSGFNILKYDKNNFDELQKVIRNSI